MYLRYKHHHGNHKKSAVISRNLATFLALKEWHETNAKVKHFINLKSLFQYIIDVFNRKIRL